MQRKDIRELQTIEFLKWTRKHMGLWEQICDQKNEHISLDTMQTLIKKLSKEGFYEIIFVLLEVHKNKEYMKALQEV